MGYYNLAILFKDVFEKNSDKLALLYSNKNQNLSISYKDLGDLSNRIANYLHDTVGNRSEVVAILNDKSPMGFACMLAAILNGMPYVNLDPHSPVSRIEKIINSCKPKVLFYADQFSNLAEGVAFKEIRKVSFSCKIFLSKLNSFSPFNLKESNAITGESPAYIMFTSGSTGFPKGAVMTHDNILNLIEWVKTRFNIQGNEIFTNVNPLYFDNSVFDFYGSLFNGITLAPFNQDETRQAKILIDEIENLNCTHWFSVPSLIVYILKMKAISCKSLPYLKTIIFGGEGFPKTLLRKLHELFPTKKLVNVYGPTECSCICSSHDVVDKDMESSSLLPLGTINPNYNYLILDSSNRNVSKGEIGELCLLGPCVGKGYYNNQVNTREAFIQNPYNISYPEIIYKTGDLVWEDIETGLLYFKSRKDYQIKHMGYRIELQEIETILGGLPQVIECAVVYQKDKEATSGHIIAHLVVESENRKESKFLNLLRNELPYYMIPNKVYVSESLPKNANGKIDRLALASL